MLNLQAGLLEREEDLNKSNPFITIKRQTLINIQQNQQGNTHYLENPLICYTSLARNDAESASWIAGNRGGLEQIQSLYHN